MVMKLDFGKFVSLIALKISQNSNTSSRASLSYEVHVCAHAVLIIRPKHIDIIYTFNLLYVSDKSFM